MMMRAMPFTGQRSVAPKMLSITREPRTRPALCRPLAKTHTRLLLLLLVKPTLDKPGAFASLMAADRLDEASRLKRIFITPLRRTSTHSHAFRPASAAARAQAMPILSDTANIIKIDELAS